MNDSSARCYSDYLRTDEQLLEQARVKGHFRVMDREESNTSINGPVTTCGLLPFRQRAFVLANLSGNLCGLTAIFSFREDSHIKSSYIMFSTLVRI